MAPLEQQFESGSDAVREAIAERQQERAAEVNAAMLRFLKTVA